MPWIGGGCGKKDEVWGVKLGEGSPANYGLVMSLIQYSEKARLRLVMGNRSFPGKAHFRMSLVSCPAYLPPILST